MYADLVYYTQSYNAIDRHTTKIHYIWNLTCWKDNNVIMTILFITILKMLNYAPNMGTQL